METSLKSDHAPGQPSRTGAATIDGLRPCSAQFRLRLSFGISELLAGAMGAPSLIQGVADWVVDSVPARSQGLGDFGVRDQRQTRPADRDRPGRAVQRRHGRV